MNAFQRYRVLLQRYVNPNAIPVLYRNWTDKSRKYHGIAHLEDVLAYIERWSYRFNKEEFESLILAAFFHDAVYGVKDAEDQSILFFKMAYIGEGINTKLVDEAIECTKHRKKPTKVSLKVFWEADNQIFKKSWRDYLLWESGIKFEYSHVADDIYIKKRIEFLNENLGKFGPRADSYLNKLINQIGDK